MPTFYTLCFICIWLVVPMYVYVYMVLCLKFTLAYFLFSLVVSFPVCALSIRPLFLFHLFLFCLVLNTFNPQNADIHRVLMLKSCECVELQTYISKVYRDWMSLIYFLFYHFFFFFYWHIFISFANVLYMPQLGVYWRLPSALVFLYFSLFLPFTLRVFFALYMNWCMCVCMYVWFRGHTHLYIR